MADRIIYKKGEPMSKKEVVEPKTSDVVKHDGKTDAELNETIEVLTIQLKEHTEKASHHQTMALKIQGAREILEQLVTPKDHKENGVAAD